VLRPRKLASAAAPTLTPAAAASQSPALAVVGFGAYLVVWLAYGVVTFRTLPEEAEALHRDITRARAGLRALGYDY
jgi:hypothetical protein